MIDLKFGDPQLIRDRLRKVNMLPSNILGYRMQDQCEENITSWVRKYYKKNFKLEYKHIILTHGAIGGLQVLVNTLKSSKDTFVINDLSFGWYERVLRLENVNYLKSKDISKESGLKNSLYIVDSPSNPWGKQVDLKLNPSEVIWDSVYASSVFAPRNFKTPPHDIMVGSMSKMFGLSGLRIGWIGLNDDILAKKLYENALTIYCGLSTPSLEIANSIVEEKVDTFEYLAKLDLDSVRDNFQRLRNIFGMDAPENGMFYMGYSDSSIKKLLVKAEVEGLELTTLDGQDYIRFNMADSEKNTKQAIKDILMADRI